jgi:hypothetical protein
MSTGEENAQRGSPRPWRAIRWSAALGLLMVPLVAMQFTDEVNWDLADFAVFGVMLTVTCLGFDFLNGRSRNLAYQLAVGVGLMTGFLLVWVSLAVGLIGAANDDANLMYGGVLAIAVCGAVMARWQATGMARALIATAVAQAVAALIALGAGLGRTGPDWPQTILVLTTIFCAMWLISAGLFWRASRPGR